MRQLAALLCALVLSVPALAGDMQNPGITDSGDPGVTVSIIQIVAPLLH